MNRHLIINADDLGISCETNLAIEQAFREGIATSASLMANMPAFDHAVEHVIGRNPALGIGLHLCLTSGRPVLPPSEVPLLLDAEGMFRHGFFGLIRLLRSHGRDALSQISRELAAQSQRVDDCGIVVDHINGHQHIHMIPGIFPVAAKLARERNAAVRLPVAGSPRPRLPLRHRLQFLASSGMLKVAILSALSRQARQQAEPFVAADSCLGVAESGVMTLPLLRDLLQNLQPGVTEIFVHPGLPLPANISVTRKNVTAVADVSPGCSLVDQAFLQSACRATELHALLSPALRQLLAAQGVMLTNFREAWQEKPQRKVA